MKLLIAGSRSFNDIQLALKHFIDLQKEYQVTEIVSGGAKGADKVGETLAGVFNIPIKRFLPDWDKYSKKAGMLRNIEMGDYCDIALIFWDRKSKGTKHMIEYLNRLEKPYRLITF